MPLTLADVPFPRHQERNLDQWERYNRIIELRAQGKGVREIASLMNMSADGVTETIGRIAEWAREKLKGRTEELFLVHDHRLEALYRKVQARIDAMDDQVFDDKVFRVALLILERQSRLYGLDKKGSGGNNVKKYSWIENASPTELIEKAEAAGLSVPPAWKRKFTLEDADRAVEEKAERAAQDDGRPGAAGP